LNNLEFYKEMLTNEIEQKERINNRITVPMGIIVLLAGGAFSLLDRINNLNHGFYFSVFLILLSLLFILIVITSVLLFKAFIGHKYIYLPYASDIKNIADYWQGYFDANYENLPNINQLKKHELIENHFRDQLETVIISAVDTNIESNEKKIRYLQSASYLLVASLICGLLTLVPYCLSLDIKKSTEIHINNWPDYTVKGGAVMSNESEGNQNNPTSSSVPAPKPPELKPRVIQESFSLNVNKPNTKIVPEQRPQQRSEK